MGKIDNLARQGRIFFVEKMGTVDHDGGKSRFDAGDAEVIRVAVIQMEDDRDLPGHFLPGFPFHHLDCAVRHMAQQRPVRIIPGPFRNLDDDGRLGFQAGHYDRLELFHVIEIVGRNGEAPLYGGGKHHPRIDDAKRCVMYAHTPLLIKIHARYARQPI